MLLSETHVKDNDKLEIVDYDEDFKHGQCRVDLISKVDDEIEPSITFVVSFDKPVFTHEEDTYVPYGSTYVKYIEAGEYLDDIDVASEPAVFELASGEKVTKEQFIEACQLTEQEYAETIEMCMKGVNDKAKDWALDNSDEFATSNEPEDDESWDDYR